MTAITSLSLSKQLYEAFGWMLNDTDDSSDMWGYPHYETEKFGDFVAPKYDLSYLLEKLPNHYPEPGDVYNLLLVKAPDNSWIVGYCHRNGKDDFDWRLRVEETNPEEAAGLLALKLHAEGVL